MGHIMGLLVRDSTCAQALDATCHHLVLGRLEWVSAEALNASPTPPQTPGSSAGRETGARPPSAEPILMPPLLPPPPMSSSEERPSATRWCPDGERRAGRPGAGLGSLWRGTRMNRNA